MFLQNFRKVKGRWALPQKSTRNVQLNNSSELQELIGDIAKKLHTGRSRNDQTITDTKLWLRKSIDKLLLRVKKFVEVNKIK